MAAADIARSKAVLNQPKVQLIFAKPMAAADDASYQIVSSLPKVEVTFAELTVVAKRVRSQIVLSWSERTLNSVLRTVETDALHQVVNLARYSRTGVVARTL